MHNLRRTFQRFVDVITTKPDDEQLRDALEGVISTFDLCSFAYLVLSAPEAGSRNLISNYPPTWTMFYLENSYQELDPVILKARRDPEPFLWGPELDCGESAVARRFFDEASQFGLRNGLTIPIHDDRHAVAAVTFAADQQLPAFQRCIDLHLPLLQLLSVFFDRYARRAMRPVRSIGDITLSRREFECLSWAAEGKSAWEIGRILDISGRTAAFHLDNARTKLRVGTVKQAIALLAADRASRA